MLFRHAKSDRTPIAGGDHQRPLNARGELNAAAVGRFLSDPGLTPHAAITSTALRASQTLQLAMEAGGWNCPVREVPALYSGTIDEMIEELRGEDREPERLLLVGHQPALSDLASQLIGGGEIDFPTAALVAIRFEAVKWGRIVPGQGSLAWMITPGLLGGDI